MMFSSVIFKSDDKNNTVCTMFSMYIGTAFRSAVAFITYGRSFDTVAVVVYSLLIVH